MDGAQRVVLMGILLCVAWVPLTSFQVVYTGHLVQGIDPIVLLVVCSTITFVIANALQLRDVSCYTRLLRQHARTIVAVNLLTLASWASSFACLRFIEPTAAETFGVAVMPIAATMSAMVMRKRVALLRTEVIASFVTVAASVGLGLAIFAGKSSVGDILFASAVVGIVAALVTGVFNGVLITYLKSLADGGFSPMQVMGARLFVLIPTGIFYIFVSGRSLAPLDGQATGLLLLSVVGVMLPNYAGQLGISKTEPTTAALIGSLAPAMTFAMQQADGRLQFSIASGTAVGVIVVAVVWSSVVRLRMSIATRNRRRANTTAPWF